MTLRSVLTTSAACILLSAPLYAATVTLNVSGTTAEADGSLAYTSGSTFTATATFDDSFADTNGDPNVGTFFDFGTATTALTSFELTTEFGTVRYDPASVTGTVLAPQVGQIQTPNQQTVSFQSHLGGGVFGNGWTGTMGALAPSVFSLTMSATGLGDYLFDDANTLFSGAVGGLDTDFDLFGGLITLADGRGIETTELFFGAGESSITGGAGEPPVSAVPLPASLPLLLAGFGALGFIQRRKGAMA